MILQDALFRCGVKYRVSADPNEISVCCPFCSERGETPDTRFRLGVNTKTGWAHCFNCGWKSRHAIGYLLKRLGSTERITEDNNQPEVEAPSEICLPKDFMVLKHCYDDLDQKALSYLTQRGVTKDQILRNRIGVSYFGRYAYHIVFPVMDRKTLRGFVARDFTGMRRVRYLNSPGDKYLYNYHRPAKQVLLSEGIFKALRLEQAADSDTMSMALLGHDVTEKQLVQLQKANCTEAILWPDPDPVGRRGMITVADKLSENGLKVSIQTDVVVPADEEPLETLKAHFQSKTHQKYSWRVRQILLQK